MHSWPTVTFKAVHQLPHPLTCFSCIFHPACIPLPVCFAAGDVDAPIVVPLVAAVVVTVAVTFAVPAYLNRGEYKMHETFRSYCRNLHAGALPCFSRCLLPSFGSNKGLRNRPPPPRACMRTLRLHGLTPGDERPACVCSICQPAAPDADTNLAAKQHKALDNSNQCMVTPVPLYVAHYACRPGCCRQDLCSKAAEGPTTRTQCLLNALAVSTALC